VRGLVIAAPLPAAYLRAWITTFVVSIGWIMDEAIQPESDPTRNGFAYWLKNESLEVLVIMIIRKWNLVLNL